MKSTTIGHRILAAVIAHKLDIPADRAMKLYVQEREIDPSWDQIGETLLKGFVIEPTPRNAAPDSAGIGRIEMKEFALRPLPSIVFKNSKGERIAAPKVWQNPSR